MNKQQPSITFQSSYVKLFKNMLTFNKNFFGLSSRDQVPSGPAGLQGSCGGPWCRVSVRAKLHKACQHGRHGPSAASPHSGEMWCQWQRQEAQDRFAFCLCLWPSGSG